MIAAQFCNLWGMPALNFLIFFLLFLFSSLQHWKEAKIIKIPTPLTFLYRRMSFDRFSMKNTKKRLASTLHLILIKILTGRNAHHALKLTIEIGKVIKPRFITYFRNIVPLFQ